MIGEETNVIKRRTLSGSYRGNLGFGTLEAIAQYELTKNRRLNEGLAGGPEGTFNTTTEFSTATLRNWYAQTTLDMPFSTGPAEHVLTVGAEYRYEYLNDPYSMSQGIGGDLGQIPGAEPGERSGESDADTYAAFIEDNILVGPVTLTPGLRFDRHSTFGSNWAPSLSVTYAPVADVTIKGGIAKAFKAPNLYQSNPNYLYYTRGFGCPLPFPNLGGGCYIQGNPDLDAETSVNKEIGVAWTPGRWNFTATYFRNDYDAKIISGNVPIGESIGGAQRARIFRWYNSSKAIVEGVEGSVLIPVMDTLTINTNVTYMIQNEEVATGRLLSVVPEYTINTTLDWQITEAINLVGTFTRYGEQQPNAVFYSGAQPSEEELRPREPYNLVSLNVLVRVSPAFRYSVGVNNLFDERVSRESHTNAQGANNYNEPGRAFFMNTTFTF
jgi:ferric enterobactin receptor